MFSDHESMPPVDKHQRAIKRFLTIHHILKKQQNTHNAMKSMIIIDKNAGLIRSNDQMIIVIGIDVPICS